MANVSATLEKENRELIFDAFRRWGYLQADLDSAGDRGVDQSVSRDFTENFPARSTVAASGLALGAKLEVEMIAVKRK